MPWPRTARLFQHGRESGPALAHACRRDRLPRGLRHADDHHAVLNLLLYIGLLLNFFAVLSVASLFIFRKRPGWQKLGVVSFAYPLIPGVLRCDGHLDHDPRHPTPTHHLRRGRAHRGRRRANLSFPAEAKPVTDSESLKEEIL